MPTFWKVFIAVIVTAGIVGGGGWWYMSKKATDEKSKLQVQIDDLNKQISELKAASLTSTSTTDETTDWKIYTNDKYGFSLTLNDKWKNYKVFNRKDINDFLSGNAEDEFRLCLPSIDERPFDPKSYACPIAILIYEKSAYEKEWDESETTGNISSASVGTKLGEKNNKVFVSNYLWINEPSDLKDIDSKELKNILSTFQFTK